jgi:acyl-[acyl-carrier-protein]-phospholipid O-acyltransferase/long-chain-fatty-acid--[acyl-carrier-protein] ligase
VLARIVDPDTGQTLPAGADGMLWIQGPNVMAGYLNKPEQTAEVLRDGWYVTGDIGHLDEQGFIHITGRLSRFSKLGGEMVPHVKIEDALQGIVGGDDEELKAAVTAVPDPRKGERIVVLHTSLDKTPQEICQALAAAGLPNLFIPSPDSFRQVDELPILGSGKLDLKALKQRALELFGSAPQE